MLQRHLAVAHAIERAPVERVEALHAREAVVGAVRVLAVQQLVPADLDLVRGVVGEEPGLGGLAQAHLQQRRGQHQRQRHQHGHAHAGPRGPVAPAQAHHAHGGDQQRGQEAGGAGDAHVPLAVGGAHQRRQDALRVHGARAERPRVRAQLGQRDGHDAQQHAQQGEHPLPGEAPAHAEPGRFARGPVHPVVAPGPGQLARGHRQHHPGQRVLQEARIEQRVGEQGQQRGAQGDAQALVQPAHGQDRARAAHQQPARTAPARSRPARRPRSAG